MSFGNETLWEGESQPAGTGVTNAEGIYTKIFGRDPIPDAYTNNTISSCHNHDPVCSPGTGSLFNWAAPHTTWTFEEAASLASWAAPHAVAGLSS